MTTEGTHVRIATLGDERQAVIERVTGEPLQYITPGGSTKALLDRWDAVIESAMERARSTR